MTTNIIDLFKTKNIELFENFTKTLDDINEYVFSDENCDNFLNLLHFCAGISDQQLNDNCLQCLLSFPNIDVNYKAKIEGIHGITAAHIAAQWGHYNTLKVLITFGSDLYSCDANGRNVYDYAIESNDENCLQLVAKAMNDFSRTDSKYYFRNENDSKCTKFSPNNSQSNENCFITKDLLVSDKTLHDIKNNSNLSEDCEQTELYFDENSSVWDHMKDNSNESQSTLKSNVSYEKTDSIKSCCTDIAETYLYTDRDHNVLLIEERYQGSSSLTKINDSDVISISCVTKDDNDKDVDEVIKLMNDTQIYAELKAMGDSPGPIMKTTRSLYVKRLGLMKRGKYSPSKRVLPLPEHCEELNRLIQKTFPFDEAIKLERQLMDYFEKDKNKKNYFTYILLDPNITENLPFQANVMNTNTQIEMNLFIKFVNAIFYIGKGQGNRAYEHFYEAIKLTNNDNKPVRQLSDKIDRILKIWSTEKGVISLHCFPSICSDEALTREALMIEALMLSNLTNKMNGQLKCNLKWNDKKRRIIGSYLLYKSFLILLLNGERQIKRPQF